MPTHVTICALPYLTKIYMLEKSNPKPYDNWPNEGDCFTSWPQQNGKV
jgi:hypothetical protein